MSYEYKLEFIFKKENQIETEVAKETILQKFAQRGISPVESSENVLTFQNVECSQSVLEIMLGLLLTVYDNKELFSHLDKIYSYEGDRCEYREDVLESFKKVDEQFRKITGKEKTNNL